MNILLKNISNTYNYGSMMMAENLITYITKKISDVKFYIEADTYQDVERLRIATKNDNIYCDNVLKFNLITGKIKYIRVLERKLRRKSHVKKASLFYDAIIILGGDDFSEVYYKFPKDNLEIKFVFEELKMFNSNSNLIMVGQTIGPYTGKRINLAKETFKDIKIYTRDLETKKYLKNVLGTDSFESRDLAFLDLNLQKEYLKNKGKILSKYNLEENNYITVVGTGLLSNYSKNPEEMVDAFYNLIKRLIKEKYNVVCLAHVFTKNGIDDNILYKRIDKKYNNFISNNCILIDKPILPVEARIILGLGKFTITCRMHAAVSTFQMGHPAICISYSKKYKGVIADGLKFPNLVLDAKQKNFWKKFETLVFDRINYIKNDSSIESKIADSVSSSKKIVSATLDDICKHLKGE